MYCNIPKMTVNNFWSPKNLQFPRFFSPLEDRKFGGNKNNGFPYIFMVSEKTGLWPAVKEKSWNIDGSPRGEKRKMKRNSLSSLCQKKEWPPLEQVTILNSENGYRKLSWPRIKQIQNYLSFDVFPQSSPFMRISIAFYNIFCYFPPVPKFANYISEGKRQHSANPKVRQFCIACQGETFLS